MRGKLLKDTKNALSASLHKLGPEDSFSIIAFNSEVYQSSTSLELATPEAIDKSIEWIETNFVPGEGTNILNPLNKVSWFLISFLSQKQKLANISTQTFCIK